ncbi:MAG: DUF3221 domain-containing protein [Clostridia bacterium]|nr:DUF3221 domain-containing protein [Clostridia bacterium]
MKRIIGCFLILIIALACLSCEGESEVQTFKMKAKIDKIGEKIEVTVTEAEYAEGVYWLVIGDLTEFQDSDGASAHISDFSEGDFVEITYNGQVMMSYPPQIAALKIKKLK